MRDSSQPPTVSLGWGGRTDPGVLLDPELARAALRRRATVALVVHAVLMICLFAVPSIAGVALAALARRAVADDPARAERLITWSWACIAVDLLFYLLLAAVGLILAAYLFLIVRSANVTAVHR